MGSNMTRFDVPQYGLAGFGHHVNRRSDTRCGAGQSKQGFTGVQVLRRWYPGRFRSQWALLVVVWVALVGVLTHTQLTLREAIVSDEQARLLTLTRVATQMFVVQVESADAALRTMRDSLDRWRAGDGFAPFAMEHLKRVEKMMPGVRTFVVLDAQGLCQLSNRPELVGQHFGERDYFVQAVASAAQGKDVLTVSAPYRTVLGAWAVNVTRVVRDSQGAVAGLVVATLSPEYFSQLMADMAHAPDMRVALIHETGRLYVSVPVVKNADQVDFMLPGAFARRHRDAGVPESVNSGATTFPGGGQRVVAVKTVSLAGLGSQSVFYAGASRSADAVLAEWRRDAMLSALSVLVLVAMSAASLLLYQRWVGRLERKAHVAEAALRASHAKYEQLANTLPCVLFDFEQQASGQLVVQFVSPFAQTLLGVAAQTLQDDPRAVLRHLFPEDAAALKRQHTEAHAQQQPYECTLRVQRPDSQVAHVQISATPTPVPGKPGVTLWSGFVFDVTDRMQLESELRHMAFHDPLTGAHNRRSFMQALAQEAHRVQRTGEHAALLMLDIDHFKRVNDTFGHDAGDDVLKHLVTTLQAVLRRLDLLGRLGGEEFAVLLPATGLQGASELAERLRLAIEKNPAPLQRAVQWTDPQSPQQTTQHRAQQSVAYTISIGVAVLGPEAADPDEALTRADHAMYRAKTTGRNRVCAEGADPVTASGPSAPTDAPALPAS